MAGAGYNAALRTHAIGDAFAFLARRRSRGDDVIGRHLGPYHVVSKLGEGGMGEVYRARDSRLQRDLALQILPAALAHDPAHIERFRREARAVAALTYPNSVTIHSVEEWSGHTCTRHARAPRHTGIRGEPRGRLRVLLHRASSSIRPGTISSRPWPTAAPGRP